MDTQQLVTTNVAILAASKLSKSAPNAVTNFERDLIEATLVRYPDSNSTRNQTIAFIAYTNSMRQLHAKYPGNPDAAALFAESLMNLEANDYFKQETMGSDDKAIIPNGLRPFSKQASDVLVSVLSSTEPTFARHPLALHLYIHLTEAGVPGMKDGAMTGEQAADTLRSLNYTGSGHLEHMPGHLYLRVGRYYDAVRSNALARVADQYYDAHSLAPYGPCHNQYFGVYSACVAGMSRAAIEGSMHMRNVYAQNTSRPDAPGLEQGWNALLTTYLRFGQWSDILKDTGVVPVSNAPYADVLRAYSRGFALLHLQNDVGPELVSLQKAQERVVSRSTIDSSGFNGMAVRLAEIANLTLSAAVLLRSTPRHGSRSSRMNEMLALELVSRAAVAQDGWHYDEPPDWHYSIDACAGKVLLDQGALLAAEAAYVRDLHAYPNNCWGLTGLLQTYTAQKRPQAEIDGVRARLVKSWEHADVPLPTSSCHAFDF